MLKNLGKILLAVSLTTSISVLLSGCLVKKEDPASVPSFTSNTNQLRIYQPFDTIYYNVRVDSANGTQSGTLQVKWEDTAPITDPIASPTQQYFVHKETSTLAITGGDTDELIRYVEQDPTTGSLYLRAFPTPTDMVNYWLSPTITPTSSLQSFEIFHSPLTLGSTTLDNFYVVGDCSGGTQCLEREALVQSRSFTVTAVNQTVDIPGTGIFKNAYTVQYDTTTTREATAPPLLDILDVCGSIGNFTITSHSATLYIVPEIGVIKMVNECTDTSSNSDVIYTATLDRPNFQY